MDIIYKKNILGETWNQLPETSVTGMESESNPVAEGMEVDIDDLLLCGEGDFAVDENMEIEESLGEEADEEEETMGGGSDRRSRERTKRGESERRRRERSRSERRETRTDRGRGWAEVLGGEGEEEEGDDKQLPQCHHLQLVRHENSTVE